MSDKQLITAIEEFVNNFKEMLDVEADVKCSISEGDRENQKVVNVTFDGDKLGYMIGNQGKHLSALQYILSMMINKKFAENPEERLYVSIDVSGYKKQKEDKIESIAMRMADDARILGEPVDMEPMSPSDRRVVHMVLSKFDDIKTESFGDGEDRAVRITPIGESELGIDSFKKGLPEEEGEEAEE